MTNILSAVSGQFGKGLILGTLLPVIVFVLLAWVFVVPLLPADLRVLEEFGALDPEWKLASVSFAILVLAGLLLSLNTPLVRFHEGYPWKESWIGRLLVDRARRRFDALQARWRGMRTLYYAILSQANFKDECAELVERWSKIGLAVNRYFPSRRDLVLPTRLGNAIRSFETYPEVQYGIDSIVLWPRLVGAMSKDYAAAIDEAKSSFDFMLNSAVLSAVTAASILLAGLLHPIPLVLPGRWIEWLIQVVLFALLSYWFYLLSIGRAVAWGEMVKAGFDLYRGALLRQLGYEMAPTTRPEERRIWDVISRQILYGDSPRLQPPVYSACGTFAHGEPSYVSLVVGRGVTRAANAELVVTIQVRNTDPQGRPARSVTVTDTLPEGFDYGWGSASIPHRKIEVSGSNPYQFEIGDLEFAQTLDLTYRAIARRTE